MILLDTYLLGRITDSTDPLFQRRFTLLSDRADLPDHWHTLVKTLGIRGLKAHDARLVAAMQTYAIARILTFNANDFRSFSVTIIRVARHHFWAFPYSLNAPVFARWMQRPPPVRPDARSEDRERPGG